MYIINNYRFSDFKCNADLHKSNYAVLIDQPERGIKYAPYADFSDEYNILRELNHKQLPKVYDIGQGNLYRNEKFLIKQNYLILQHIQGLDIIEYFMRKDIKQPATINEAIRMFLTICCPLQYLHHKNYIHCDLKPGHLIYNQKTGLVYLIDFELAMKQGEIIKGISKEYASPEQLEMLNLLRKHLEDLDEKKLSSSIHLDGRTDLYSVGLLLYQVLTKHLWQEKKDRPRTFNKQIPKRLEEIVLGLLETDALNRIPSAEKLKDELNEVLTILYSD